MKLIAQLKLTPNTQHATLLQATLQRANAACNAISRVAWDTGIFSKFPLQERTYHAIRDQFGLSAQMTIRCLAKVADTYTRDRDTLRTFKRHGAIAYDDRILTYHLADQTVSIWTLEGRITVPFVAGARHLTSLQTQQGESDLVYRNDQFYLLATCEVAEPELALPDDVLGVDFGIVQLATDSDGTVYSGAHLERVRVRYQKRRDRLQAVGTKSAKRRLKKNSGRQRRFQANENHRIAKQLVAKAKDTQRALALEELTGIRTRTTVRKSQRARQGNWAFGQLRSFLAYKARRAGVLVAAVDPRNTSRTCSRCGYCDPANRTSQAQFCCLQCGYATHADLNAACNIRERAAVNRPMAPGLRA